MSRLGYEGDNVCVTTRLKNGGKHTGDTLCPTGKLGQSDERLPPSRLAKACFGAGSVTNRHIIPFLVIDLVSLSSKACACVYNWS
jgi:hypothetical protein